MPRRGRLRTKTITTGGLACLSRIYNHPFVLLKMHFFHAVDFVENWQGARVQTSAEKMAKIYL
jgi:hypothetical protein